MKKRGRELTGIVVVLVVHAAHGVVEHLHSEHGVAIVAEDKEVTEL